MAFWNKIKTKIAAFNYLVRPKYRRSYSQCGEDIIISRLLRDIGIVKPFYLDIGANDPVVFSNTYLFYRRGARGICVEPNPALTRKIKRKRRGDLCLEMGVGLENGSKEFFLMDSDGLSTFSPKEAVAEEQKGHHIISKIRMPIRTLDRIIRDAGGRTPDLLSLDVEGLDRDILESLDFEALRPKVMCLETRSFGGDDREARSNLISFMEKKGYELGGVTPINSIFIDPRSKKSAGSIT